MRPCVDERDLVQAYYGEGDAADRAHLGACLRCAARYQRLARDLQAIGQALAAAPPVGASRPGRAFRRRRVLVAAVALVGLAAFAGLEGWMWRESFLWVRPASRAMDAGDLRFLAEVSTILSPAGDVSGGAFLTPAPEAASAPAADTDWTDEAEMDQAL